MSNPTPSVESVAKEAARLLGAYIKSNRTRVDILRECASVVVDLRALFTLEDGRTDWSGRSPEYRRVMHDVYAAARVPTDRYDTVQAALRYHVGNLLREKVRAEDLAAVGLSGVSPRERLARNRDVVSAMSKSGAVSELTGDPVRLVVYAESLLDHVNADNLSRLTAAQKSAVRRALAGLAERTGVLSEAVGPKRATRRRAV